MRRSSLRPRDSHIAELTRGQRLPLAPIPQAHLEVLVETLARVWADLNREHETILEHGDESEINALMEMRLNSLVGTDILWSQLVTSVVRGRESLSFDGSHLEKRPDLSVYMTGANPSFPLVIECKLLDKPSGKGIDLYCSKGITRFIQGEYAWAQSDALMMAYIRDGSTVDRHLTPALKKGASRSPDPWKTERLPSRAITSQSNVFNSFHGRDFVYAGAAAASPGPIALWHLWLRPAAN
jgi:hypothetical protein